MTLLREDEIELEKSFIPVKLFFDDKFLYCFSKSNQVLMIKKEYKLDKKKYINCTIKLFDKEINFIKDITQIESFKMYNSLCINNLFILDNEKEKKKYIGTFINNKNNNYLLNIFEFNNKSNIFNQLSDTTNYNITYNNKKFVYTNLNKNTYDITYNMSSNEVNNLLDYGIYLLPFSSKEYNNNDNCIDNIYEYLLQQYCSIIIICGNFDLMKNEKESILIKFPFSLYCNFDNNILNFIIKCIIENDNLDNIKLYYFIILKQIICIFYNTNSLEEVHLKDLFPYFKELIIKNIKEKDKHTFNKILKQIIVIIPYIKNYTIIEIEDLKYIFDDNYNDINYKTILLLIELLLEQTKTQKQKELYEILIKIEKNYLVNIFNNEINDILDLTHYSTLRKIMIKASEILFKLNYNIKKELLDLIPYLSDNIHEIIHIYLKALDNKNLKISLYKFSFIYNSFIFRSFYLILEMLIANKSLLNNKNKIFELYKIVLLLDKYDNNCYDYYDMNNIIEWKYPFNNKNYDYYDDDNQKNLTIKLNEVKNIIIKRGNSSNQIVKFLLIKSNGKSYKINKLENDFVFHNVKEINIILDNRNIEREYRINDREKNLNINDFVIYIIPIKDEKGYNKFKDNEE